MIIQYEIVNLCQWMWNTKVEIKEKGEANIEGVNERDKWQICIGIHIQHTVQPCNVK